MRRHSSDFCNNLWRKARISRAFFFLGVPLTPLGSGCREPCPLEKSERLLSTQAWPFWHPPLARSVLCRAMSCFGKVLHAIARLVLLWRAPLVERAPSSAYSPVATKRLGGR
jgi:hypothetical protein